MTLDSRPEQPLTSSLSRGLPNLGQTCYINSVMQAILNMPDVNSMSLPSPVRKFHEAMFDHKTPSRNDFLARVRTARHNLDTMMGNPFLPNHEEDAHEFAMYLTNMEGMEAVKELFEIGYSTYYKCIQEGCTRERTNHSVEFEVSIEPNVELNQALYISTRQNYIEDDLKCDDRCDEENECKSIGMHKYPEFFKLPRYLMVRTAVFDTENGGRKRFLKENYRPYLNQIQLHGMRQTHDYKCISIVTHIGINARSGHYMSYVNKNGTWYRYNDENVTMVGQDIIFAPIETVYLSFYQKM